MRPTPPPLDEAFVGLSTSAYRVAFRPLGDRREAEDIDQEAFEHGRPLAAAPVLASADSGTAGQPVAASTPERVRPC